MGWNLEWEGWGSKPERMMKIWVGIEGKQVWRVVEYIWFGFINEKKIQT